MVLCSQIYLLFWFLFSNILIFLNWFSVLKYLVVLLVLFSNTLRDSRGRDRMVVGFTISTYHHYCEFEPRSWRGILDTTLCDLRQVAGFLWVLRFPPPIKLTATIELKYCWSDIKHHNPNPWLNMCSENKCKQHIIFFLNKLKSYNEF